MARSSAAQAYIGPMAAGAAMAAAQFRQAPKDGTGWGLQLHRDVPPGKWPQALARVPEEHRAAAESYLRGIAARMRILRDLKGHGPDGPPSS